MIFFLINIFFYYFLKNINNEIYLFISYYVVFTIIFIIYFKYKLHDPFGFNWKKWFRLYIERIT